MTIVVARRQKRFTMEGSASSINSRSTAIKTILLSAWRNKLSQDEWTARIKKVLPRGVNGDVYDLADCLLKQALVGPVPNQLFMSYLRHAVQCELVSHGAVLSSISNQPVNVRQANGAPSRVSSIMCLVEFLKIFRDKISCKETEIECLSLCHSLGLLINWLLKCIQSSIETYSMAAQILQQQKEAQQQSQSTTSMSANSGSINIISQQLESILSIIDVCSEMIHYFINRPFTKSLLYVCKIEYSNSLFDETNKILQGIQQKMSSSPNLQSHLQDRSQYFIALHQFNVTFNSLDLHPSVVAAKQLRCVQMNRIRSTQAAYSSSHEKKVQHQQQPPVHDSTTNYALFNSLYPLVAFDVVLRPDRPHRLLAQQIATMTSFNSAPINMTYCELIRVCMIGLIDSDGKPSKPKWAFFTFLKLPKVLLELGKVNSRNNTTTSLTSANIERQTPFANNGSRIENSSTIPTNKNQISIFMNDLRLAFERLCEYSPLLDEAEYRNNFDLFDCLIKELIKNEPNLQQLLNVDFRKLSPRQPAPNQNGGQKLLKTEPVLAEIVASYNSETDPSELFYLAASLVSGKQFEFSLSAAASTNRLKLFVRKLLERCDLFGNPQKQPSNANANQLAQSKNLHIRALNFDMTFLILTFIVQQYGPELLGHDKKSIFTKWFYDCYNQSTRINCPKEMLKSSNEEMVTNLIKQFLHPKESGIQITASYNWLETISNLPKALSEILNAWNQGVVKDEQIEVVIERIKSKMCCLAVVAATWLQCHIKVLDEKDKAKPMYFLQSLTKASSPRQDQQQQGEVENESGLRNENYAERSSLMYSIIKKIYFEFAPSKSNDTSNEQQAQLQTKYETPMSSDELSHHSVNGKFISTLSTHEIFMANVKQCLKRGWIDYKSLNSLSSLHKLIGSECFTNLIVEQVLTSHESPSDLSRAINITFGLFHIDIEACSFALLNNTIPGWLMGERKQVLLTQPRAFALAHLAVMTIVEVYSNLESAKSSGNGNVESGSIINNNIGEANTRLNVNGIKQEPGAQLLQQANHNINGPKRIKLTVEGSDAAQIQQQDAHAKLEKLNNCVANLMRLFKQIMSDPVMSHRSLFPILFLQQTVVCTREGASAITVHLQPEILLDIINLFSSELTFELVLAISNLSTTESRKFAAKAICKLAQIKESKHNQHKSEHSILAVATSGSAPTSQQPTPSSSSMSGVGTSNDGGKSLMSSVTPMIIS